MTYHNSDSTCDTDRPTLTEIEVTPEMVDAGLRELAYYNPMNEDGAPVVRAIYEAMWRAYQSSKALGGAPEIAKAIQ